MAPEVAAVAVLGIAAIQCRGGEADAVERADPEEDHKGSPVGEESHVILPPVYRAEEPAVEASSILVLPPAWFITQVCYLRGAA